MQTEDGYIIRKCLKGEKEAFGLLVDKYKEGVYLLAYSKLRNFQDAEDVTQEVFIKVYRKLHSLRRWDNVMAWIYAVTSNTCKDWIRAQSRRRERESAADQNPEFLTSSSMNSYRENLAFESLHEALDSLPQAYQQALTLRYFGGMKVMEIARFLGASPSTIARRLREAKAQLREEMLEIMARFWRRGRYNITLGNEYSGSGLIRGTYGEATGDMGRGQKDGTSPELPQPVQPRNVDTLPVGAGCRGVHQCL